MVKLFSLKSPDEWATTKQACRDTYVVTCFLPSTIRIYIYIYIYICMYIYIYISDPIRITCTEIYRKKMSKNL